MQWIPTEKQLPPRGEWIIVHCPTCEGRIVRVARRHVYDDGTSTFIGTEAEITFELSTDQVPEWAPLPDAPSPTSASREAQESGETL